MDALYESLRESLEQFCSTLKGTQRDMIEKQITQEINAVLEVGPSPIESEDQPGSSSNTIAEKTLRALQTMNGKLQKEIFNYLALKLRLAFAKSGIGIGKDQTSNFLTQSTASEFFRDIEERVALREEGNKERMV